MTDALADALRRSLADGRPWFDGLQDALAARRWALLSGQCGLSRRSYRTSRIRACDANAEDVAVGAVRVPTVDGEGRTAVVEVLPSGPARPYVDLGLDLAGSDEARSPSCTDRLNRALAVLGRDTRSAAVVGATLWAVHVVRPEAADYDVSYSDPEVPFSIFVGVPETEVPHGDLRLAEGMLHECLHLQLSLVEDIVPLVTASAETHFSPWQLTMRPAQGVLHGTYVFALLGDFLRRLTESGRHAAHETEYLSDRVATCAGEVASATRALLSGSTLTPCGRELVNALAVL